MTSPGLEFHQLRCAVVQGSPEVGTMTLGIALFPEAGDYLKTPPDPPSSSSWGRS